MGSPALLNAAFRRRGWASVLVPMQVAAGDLPITLKGLRAIRNFRGLVLTTPHKVAALDFVDSIGPEARLVGSINAISCGRDGSWHGENFDGLGCVRGLETAGHRIAGCKVLLVGTGGAGSAVAAAIARKAPSSLRLRDRDTGRATRLCVALRDAFPGIEISVGSPDARGADIVINATPLGMADYPGTAIDPPSLGPGMVVADLVVEPEITALLQAAAARGCIVHPGRRTLEGQVDQLCTFFEEH